MNRLLATFVLLVVWVSQFGLEYIYARDNIELREVRKELKMIAWSTKQVEINNGNSFSGDDLLGELDDILDAVTKSVDDGKNYTLILKSKKSRKEILRTLERFNEWFTLDFMYSDWKNSLFELSIPKSSIFAQEILGDLKKGIIPEDFLWIEIVTPEVFSLIPESIWWEISQESFSGKGEVLYESFSNTWGVLKFSPESYLDQLSLNRKKVTIAVLDTGVDYRHLDLKWKVSKWKDFINDDNDAWDDHGHGTHIAGTIWANLNGKWIIWVNPYVEIVPLKVCDENGFCPKYAMIKAFDYAKKQKIDILNISIEISGTPRSHPVCVWVSSFVNSGWIVVAAAWNADINAMRSVPGGCRDSITVASIDSNLSRSWFSNYGTKIDVSAPWNDIYSTLPHDKYGKLSWTSMATSHISGFVSVIKSFDSSLDTREIKSLFRENSIDTYSESWKYIAGFPNIEKILKNLWVTQEEETQEEETEEDLDLDTLFDDLQEEEQVEEDEESEEDEEIEYEEIEDEYDFIIDDDFLEEESADFDDSYLDDLFDDEDLYEQEEYVEEMDDETLFSDLFFDE